MTTTSTMNDVLKMVGILQFYSAQGQVMLHLLVAWSLDTPVALLPQED